MEVLEGEFSKIIVCFDWRHRLTINDLEMSSDTDANVSCNNIYN